MQNVILANETLSGQNINRSQNVYDFRLVANIFRGRDFTSFSTKYCPREQKVTCVAESKANLQQKNTRFATTKSWVQVRIIIILLGAVSKNVHRRTYTNILQL